MPNYDHPLLNRIVRWGDNHKVKITNSYSSNEGKYLQLEYVEKPKDSWLSKGAIVSVYANSLKIKATATVQTKVYFDQNLKEVLFWLNPGDKVEVRSIEKINGYSYAWCMIDHDKGKWAGYVFEFSLAY
jgi:hypothetical protein